MEVKFLLGAADDEESWSHGLTSQLFWKNLHLLVDNSSYKSAKDIFGFVHNETFSLPTRSTVLPQLLQIINDKNSNLDQKDDTIIPIHSLSQNRNFAFIGSFGFAIGNQRAGKPPHCWDNFQAIVNVGAPEYEGMKNISNSNIFQTDSIRNYLYLPIPDGKKGRVSFNNYLPQALLFISDNLLQDRRTLIHCAQGVSRKVEQD
ncbi:MAG: putative initiator tRNA phosphoribosyl transferase [Streblomastix strix]|uniref:Putative initiator tRNA phosphoribosyl transferase n=1 Tax=Streblomastix strix TaxID=222440 RepID=A0A5J4V4C4_9EUKA|nr:MAG: putative initiator tRNA phosphoribosyl transferase [Streblomastix strix]